MDSVNPRSQISDDNRIEIAEARAAKAQQAAETQKAAEPQPVNDKAEESLDVQAKKAIPEIDQLRTVSKGLAQNWTTLAAAEDGSIQKAAEVDWSAWERAERGLPPEESASPDDPVQAPPVQETIGSAPRLSPRDWTSEGYRPAQPGTVQTADQKIHQVAPGVFVDDHWNRRENPSLPMFDLEGNPVPVSPPPLTGLPEGWTVDPATGAILDNKGISVGSPSQPPAPQLEEVKERVASLMVPKLSKEDIQRLTATAASKGSVVQIAPPPGKVIGSAVVAETVAAPAASQGVVSLPAAQPARQIPEKLDSVTEYRQFEEYLKNVDARLNEKFAQEYEPEPTVAPRFRGLAQNLQIQAREQILSDFVDTETGLTYAEIKTIQNRMEPWKEGLLNRERPDSDNYGPTAKDRELQANPKLAEVQARYQAQLANTPNTIRTEGHVEGGFVTYEVPPTEAERQAFAAQFVDPETGISGNDLQRLDRVLQEKKQYDRAMNELEFFKVGSFTDNDQVSKIDASKVFTAVGHDKRLELLQDGSQPLGKAHMLADGRLLLQDEHETGTWFVSRWQTSELQALGIIDTNNGGMNIDGLYLHGSAHIGTERPKGGFFGKLLNTIGHILPGGKIGELTADAISDVNQLANRPAKEFLDALGQDKDDFSMQLVLHQEANMDVLSHANETKGKTFDELVKRTAEYGAVDRAANAVGKVMVASTIPIVNWIGAGIVVASGAVIAGQAQMQGDRSADPNSGIKDAVTAYYMGQLTTGVGNMASNAAAGYAQNAGELANYTKEMSSFASSFASNLATQAASAEGKIDLPGAFEAGLLGAVGMKTTISGTGLNAVQLVEFGDSVRKAEKTGDWSEVAASLAGFITAPFKSKEPNAFERFFGVGTAAPTTPNNEEPPAGGPQSGGGPEEPEFGGAPVADDPAAPPQSGGGPEQPAANPGDPRAGLRALENQMGDQVVQQQDGSWLTVDPQQRPVRLERVDDQGRTLVTQFGEGGKVIVQRVTQPDGLVFEVNANSRVLNIETTEGGRKGFDEAFAAARAQGVGAFRWNDQTFHTGTRDQVDSLVSNFLKSNAIDLGGLGDEARRAFERQAASAADKAFSQHALNIEAGQLPNRAGFDGRSLDNEFAQALANARQLQQSQATPPAAGGAPAPTDGLDWAAILGAGTETFSGGEFSALNREVQLGFFDQDSPEVQALLRESNAKFGALRPAKEVGDFAQATSQMRSVQDRFGLSDYQLAVAVRASQYSDVGKSNRMPIHDILLGSGYANDPKIVAAITELAASLPRTVSGPDGQPVSLAHAWTGLNGMMNLNPVAATLLTHSGDWGQVYGATVRAGGGTFFDAALSTADITSALLTPGASVREALDRAGQRMEQRRTEFGRVFSDNYSPDQEAGNDLGYRIWWEHLTGGGSITDAMDRIARQVEASRGVGTNPIPFNPEQNNISP